MDLEKELLDTFCGAFDVRCGGLFGPLSPEQLFEHGDAHDGYWLGDTHAVTHDCRDKVFQVWRRDLDDFGTTFDPVSFLCFTDQELACLAVLRDMADCRIEARKKELEVS